MSVKCQLRLEGNFFLDVSYVCFGFIRRLTQDEWDQDEYGVKEMFEAGYEKVDGKMVDRDIDDVLDHFGGCLLVKHIIHIDFMPFDDYAGSDTLFHSDSSKYFKIARRILEEATMYKKSHKAMPRKRAIRATLKGQPADKIVLGLIMFRNLRYSRKGGVFETARNAGAGYLLAATLEGSFYKSSSGGWGGNPENVRFVSMTCGESAVVDFPTLGVKGVKEYLKQDPSYNPWIQEPIPDNELGYKRDGDYKEEEDIFNHSAADGYIDDWGDFTYEDCDDEEDSLDSRFRKMVHCFSYKFHEDHSIPGFSQANRFGEFELLNGCNNISPDVFTDMVKSLIALSPQE